MILEKPFYFIRHGQTDWNLEHRAMGVTDIPLNPVGIQQAVDACQHLKEFSIKTICHSPLQRAKQTAEIVHKEVQCEIFPVEELKEFCLGTYAGEIIDTWFDEWMKGKVLPEGETFQQFVERSLRGVNKALSYSGPTLIVAHGGTYWAIQQATQLLELPDLPNCTLAYFSPPKTIHDTWDCLRIT